VVANSKRLSMLVTVVAMVVDSWLLFSSLLSLSVDAVVVVIGVCMCF
jgi:hypothetical protein